MTGLHNVSFESRKHLHNSLDEQPDTARQLDQPEHLFQKLLQQEEVAEKSNSVVNLLIPVRKPARKLEKGKKKLVTTASVVFSPIPKRTS